MSTWPVPTPDPYPVDSSGNRVTSGVGAYTQRVERLVIGADYGADGYTTAEQADELARRLELKAGLLVLELGSGRGWPGLYLAKASRCRIVLTDLPLDGLRVAAARSTTDGLTGWTGVVVASGAHLPFAAETFDGIVHTDVLC